MLNNLNQFWNLSAAYYLNSRFQYSILGIAMDEGFLTILQNVIYKMESDPEVAVMCLEEIGWVEWFLLT